MSCVVMVRFVIEPNRRDEFLPVIEANASASMRGEPGCRRFDVVLPDDQPDVVLLHEVYDDTAAFEHHQTTAHFHRFEAEAAALVRSKEIVLGRLSAGSPVPAAEAAAP